MFAEPVPGITEGAVWLYEPNWVSGVFFAVAVLGIAGFVYSVFGARSALARANRLVVSPMAVGLVLMVVGIAGAYVTERVRTATIDAHNDQVDAEFDVAEESAQAALEKAYGITLVDVPFFPEKNTFNTSDPTVEFPDGHTEVCEMTSPDAYLYLDCPSDLPKDPAPERNED